jgi:hypothetical protein
MYVWYVFTYVDAILLFLVYFPSIRCEVGMHQQQK